MLVWVCFTCKRDEGLLPLHAEAIRLSDPQACIVYAVDEADADMVLPDGCERYVTHWPRRGNLLGHQALEGILQTFLDVADRYKRIPVKVDSDIVVMGTQWLSPLVKGVTGMLGICPGQLFCASGACYGIAPGVVQGILDFLSHGTYWDIPGIRVEDETISMLAAMVSEPCKVTFLQHRAPDADWVLSSIFAWPYFKDASPLRRCQAFVDCGDRKFLAAYEAAGFDATELKRRAMSACLAMLRSTPTPGGQGIS